MNRAVAKVPSFSYINRYTNTTNLTTYTFNTCDIGAADNSRRIIVAVTASSTTSANRTTSSLTISGVSATVYQNVADPRHVSFWTLPVSTGTTADIVVTMSAGCNNCSIAIYRLLNLKSSQPQDSDSATTTGATSLSTTMNASERAVVIGVCAGAAATSTTATWTNASEDYDALVESGMRTGASTQIAVGSGTTSYTVTCTASASVAMSFASISWR